MGERGNMKLNEYDFIKQLQNDDVRRWLAGRQWIVLYSALMLLLLSCAVMITTNN
jgi:hypothetical protein